MPPQPALLVLDDGELSDLVTLLAELGIAFTHLRGSSIPAQIAPPELVIVTTPRRAMLTKDWPRSAPYRIAVVTEDSNTLRAMLRRVGFDLLLRRPVHPVALRLVMLRALYRGDEKRREERVALGTPVQFRSGFWRKKALLADISQRGVRLLTEQALAAGTRINLPLPIELSATGLTLACKVVRVAAKPDAEGRYEIGLAYEDLSKDKLGQLRDILKRLSEAAGMEDGRVFGIKQRATAPPPAKAAPASPATKPPGAAAKRPAATKPLTVPLGEPTPQPAGNPADRRKQPRGAFEEQVGRLDAEGESVLLGQDLSKGGMRIEYHPNVQVGDVLELAVYASAREEPVVVKARVAHDSGDGLGLTFEGVTPEVGARLERVVARLPCGESLQAGESAGVGSVVSRVLSGFRREV